MLDHPFRGPAATLARVARQHGYRIGWAVAASLLISASKVHTAPASGGDRLSHAPPGMVLIPGGEFEMGSDKWRDPRWLVFVQPRVLHGISSERAPGGSAG